LPEDLIQALQAAVATTDSGDPEIYLALEREETVLMAGLRQGELYLLEASALVSKVDFVAHARHIPIEKLSKSQRRSILMGYAVWVKEQAADAGLKEPILA
jgi:hypothetical protein